MDFERVRDVLLSLDRHIKTRIERHGDDAYAGPHEALGHATEEYHELIEAVHDNDRAAVKAELIDLAVACVIGVASLYEKPERRVQDGG